MKKDKLGMLLALSLVVVLTACSNQQATPSTSTTSSSTTQTTSSQTSTTTSTVDAASSTSATSTTSSTDPLTTRDTGVSLESGQATLDYAVSILGDKNWVAIESNYNRTEAIPFELLQGNDGSLYRIYQNGVIVEDTQNQIVHQP